MAESVGWRYIFVFVSGLATVASVVGMLLYRETYAPVIRLRILQETRAAGKVPEAQSHLPQAHRKRLNFLFTNLGRPFMLLTRSIVCFALSAYMAL
jgi:predicted MFS family arabinose efflux permease